MPATTRKARGLERGGVVGTAQRRPGEVLLDDARAEGDRGVQRDLVGLVRG
jgi:hypothetical protein